MSLARFADYGEHRSDFDCLVLLRPDLQQHAGGGGGDLRIDLVCRHLEERLISFNSVSDLFEPPANRSFGDALTKCWEGYRGRHGC